MATLKKVAHNVLKPVVVRINLLLLWVPGDSTAGSLNEVQQINLAYLMGSECCIDSIPDVDYRLSQGRGDLFDDDFNYR